MENVIKAKKIAPTKLLAIKDILGLSPSATHGIIWIFLKYIFATGNITAHTNDIDKRGIGAVLKLKLKLKMNCRKLWHIRFWTWPCNPLWRWTWQTNTIVMSMRAWFRIRYFIPFQLRWTNEKCHKTIKLYYRIKWMHSQKGNSFVKERERERGKNGTNWKDTWYVNFPFSLFPIFIQ